MVADQLAIQHPHRRFGVTLSGGHAGGRDLVHVGQVGRSQYDVRRAKIIIEVHSRLCAGDGDDVVAHRQRPGDQELRERAALCPRQIAQALDERQVVPGIVALKPRERAPAVGGGQLVCRGNGPGEKAASERAVGDEPNAEFAAGRQQFGLGITRPHRVLRLQCGDGMHLVRAPDRPRRRLGQPDEPDLARAHELTHRPYRVLDRRVGIDAMLGVKVDHADTQTAEAGLAGFLHILGAPADPRTTTVFGAQTAELRRDDDLAPDGMQELPDEFLVPAGTIHVRRVEERDALLHGPMHRGGGLVLVRRVPVRIGHAHTTEADGRDHEPLSTQVALSHV